MTLEPVTHCLLSSQMDTAACTMTKQFFFQHMLPGKHDFNTKEGLNV